MKLTPRAAAPAPANQANSQPSAPSQASGKVEFTFGPDQFVPPIKPLSTPQEERAAFEEAMTSHTSTVGPDANFRTIERDLESNDYADQILTFAPFSLEKAALAKLPAEQQAQYRAIADELAPRMEFKTADGKKIESHSYAQQALYVLLVEGKLTPSLLKELDGVRTQAIQPPLQNRTLLSNLVMDVAMPSSIDQAKRGTCTVTTIQILTAMKRPSEYVRIVGELATPGGKARLPNGDVIAREPGTEGDDGSMRSASSRLWQAAMMEYGNGDWNYDNARDMHTSPKKRFIFFGKNEELDGGLSIPWLNRVTQAMFGKDNASYTFVGKFGAHTTPYDKLLPQLSEELRNGRPVPISLKWGNEDTLGTLWKNRPQREAAEPVMTYTKRLWEFWKARPRYDGHKVLLTRLEADKAYYTNPWGKEESMPMAEFKKRLQGVNFVKAS